MKNRKWWLSIFIALALSCATVAMGGCDDKDKNPCVACPPGPIGPQGPQGLPVGDKYEDTRMRAAKRAHGRLKDRAKIVKQLSKIDDAAKVHIYDLMNQKIVAESNLELFKYRYKHEKHTRRGKKLILQDIRSTKKTVEKLEWDINSFLNRAISKQRDLTSGVWRGTILLILFILAAGIAGFIIFFKPQAVAVWNYIKSLFSAALWR